MRFSIIALLLLVTVSTMVERSWAADSPIAVTTTVKKSAAVLSIMHRKAQRALVNAAQDRTFAQYFHAHDEAERQLLGERILDISLRVQADFHVDEMCLLDPDGDEIKRIVGSDASHDFSTRESTEVFLKPGLRQRPRSAYVSPVYLSPDADRWVVGYITPVVTEQGMQALLHYEHGLDVFQRALSRVRAPDNIVRMAVNRDGWIVWDSRYPIDVSRRAGKSGPSHYFPQFQFAGKTLAELISTVPEGGTSLSVNGQTYAFSYAREGHWYFLAFARDALPVLTERQDH